MIILQKIVVTGFMGIQSRTEIPARNFNVIVGKNDAGKSTILKAMDLFLNNKQFNSFDLNNQTNQYSEIELVFSTNNTSIVIDEDVPTTFEAEGLLNSDGFLHLIKRWDGTKKGKISAEYFVIRQSFKELDYFSLTEAKLIKLCKDNGLDAEPGLMTNSITGEAHNNSEKRSRLRAIYLERNYSFEFVEEKLPTSGQNRLKKTELAIKLHLPKFEYFLADSPLSESDSAIQKYFKDMAFRVIRENTDTDELEQTVKKHLQNVLNSITEKINSVVPESEQVTPKINFDWSKLITTGFESDGVNGSIPLSSRGDGFRRITMMAYFEYLAEERAENHQNIIFGFEEPETFLHPSAQENLFEKLNDISNSGYQVFLTTHSPILVSRSQRSNLHHIFKQSGNFKYESEVLDYSSIAEDLGITVDNQFVQLFDDAKFLLLVEGIDDCNALTHVANMYFESGDIDSKFSDKGVMLIPVGGCGSIKHWVSLDLLKNLNKPYYIYLDSDKESEEEQSKNEISLTEYGFTIGEDFSISRKRELENYISLSAIERLVPGSDMGYTDWCDVKKLTKRHRMAAALGGKKIASKHFSSLTIDELKSAFNPTNSDDEFIELYNKVMSLLD